ncbi:Fad synthetase, partial [Globisporangium splendens]
MVASRTSIRETIQHFDAFYASVDADTRARVQKALEVIHRAIDIFGLEGVCFSFNGGKDSTVVLHLLRIVIAKRVLEEAQLAEKARMEASSSSSTKTVTSPRQSFVSPALLHEDDLEARVEQAMKHVPVMYFDSHDQFPEVRDFIQLCVTKYSLNCHVYKCSFVEGVKDILEKLGIKGIYMGVRGGDPHTEDLEHYSPSTPGWPAFLRVNPILRWTYADVWSFMRECKLEYCNLYDHGYENGNADTVHVAYLYTSLGNIYDTVQNPALWQKEGDSEGHYLPAYELKDGNSERCGRQKKAHTSSKSD